jgi:hypothetical protein
MERTKKTINIEKPAIIRLPKEFVDRMRTEGVKEVVMNIDDEARILVIRPIDKK